MQYSGLSVFHYLVNTDITMTENAKRQSFLLDDKYFIIEIKLRALKSS